MDHSNQKPLIISLTQGPLHEELESTRKASLGQHTVVRLCEAGECVAQTPALLPFPDLTAPEVAYPAYAQPGVDPATIAHMSGVYLENLDMPELIEKARRAVMDTAGALLRADPNRDLQQIVLDLPCTFFMLRSLRWPPAHSYSCPLIHLSTSALTHGNVIMPFRFVYRRAMLVRFESLNATPSE